MPDDVFEMSSAQVSTLSLVSVICSVFSVIGSLFICICYLKYKNLRKYSFKLVFMLSLNDFLNQVGDFMQPSSTEVLDAREGVPGETSTLCYVQAYTESYFELSSVLWTTAIAATLYASVHNPTLKPESTYKWVLAFCQGIPLVLTLVPGFLGAYGGAGAWCWILPSFGAWRFIQFYIPLWISVIFNAYVYVKVIRVINNMVRASQNSPAARHMLRTVNRLRWYPLILVFVWGFASFNRVYESLTGNSVFWLFILQKMFSSLQGLFNAIAYGASASIRRALIADVPCMSTVYYKCCCQTAAEGDTDESQFGPVSSGNEMTNNPAAGAANAV